MTKYGDIDLGQHWFRKCFVAWWYQAITWTNVDLSSKVTCGINHRSISPKMIKVHVVIRKEFEKIH